MFGNQVRGDNLWEYIAFVVTPVARQLSRLMGKDAGTVSEFDAIAHVAEVLIKVETILALAILHPSDEIDAARIGFGLITGDGLGLWTDALQKIVNSLTVGGRRETLFVTRAFSERLEREKARPLDLAREIWSEMGEREFVFARTRLGVLQFLVALRNRAKHGATRDDQYESVNTPLLEILSWLIKSSPLVNGELLAPLKIKDGNYSCRLLRGSPSQQQVLAPARFIEHSTQLYYKVDGSYFEVPDLILYDRAGDATFILNGRRKRSNGQADYLDYVTNDRRGHASSSYAADPVEKAPSSTAGSDSLDWNATPINNLPVVDFTTYITRVEIEGEFKDLLAGKAVNFISLKGSGGVGKTTLALRVVRDLVNHDEGISFDFVLWFSARDTDLHEEHGPLPRERQVSSLYACARLFEDLIAPLYVRTEPLKPIDFFAERLSAGSEKYLLVFDNFESFDDASQLQTFVKRYLAFPSKAIITSRESAFYGDVPIEIRGMTREQARDLIMVTSRRAGCEPRINELVVTKIFDITLGNPYGIKLLVNEFARGASIEQAAEKRFSEDFLTALFRRSFERLDDDAKYVFLMIALAPLARDERFIELCCAGRSIEYSPTRERVLDAHLIDPPDIIRDHAVYRVSWAAQEFAKRIIIGTRVQRDVERDSALLAYFDESRMAVSSSKVLYQFLTESSVPPNAVDDERDRRLRAYVLETVPEVAAIAALSSWSKRSADIEDQRRLFKHALELDQSNSEVWLAWSELEEEAGEFEFSLDLALRAVDVSTTADVVVDSGRRVIRILSGHKDRVPMHRRKLYTSSVVDRLSQYADSLNAGGFSVVAWLSLISDRREVARHWVQQGLIKYDASPELNNLAQKTGLIPQGPAHGGPPRADRRKYRNR